MHEDGGGGHRTRQSFAVPSVEAVKTYDAAVLAKISLKVLSAATSPSGCF
jgi:hypothetical protein